MIVLPPFLRRALRAPFVLLLALSVGVVSGCTGEDSSTDHATPSALLKLTDTPAPKIAEGALPRPAAIPIVAEKPVLVVRTKSVNGLLDDLRYLSQLGGGGNAFERVDEILTSLNAMDLNRPLGIYACLSEDIVSSSVALLLPVADEKAFLAMLSRYEFQAKPEPDDIYTVTTTNTSVTVPLYLRFANGYAYVTVQNRSNLAPERLVDPVETLSSVPPTTLAAAVRLDRIPEQLKKHLLDMPELRLADGNAAGGAGALQGFNREWARTVSQMASSLLDGGATIEMSVDIDRKSSALVGEFKLAGNRGSPLAAAIAAVAHAKSLFAEWSSKNAAARLLVHLSLPDAILQSLAPAIDEGLGQFLAAEKDPARRERTDKLLKTIGLTLKAGELDSGLVVHGPDKDNHYTVLGGLKLVQGDAVEAAAVNLVEHLPAEIRGKIKLNADSAAGMKIHALEDSANLNEASKQIFGGSTVYFAFGPDRILVSLGSDALATIKKGLKADPEVGPIFELSASMSRLGPLLAQSATTDGNAVQQTAKAIQESFGNIDKGNDTVLISIEGGSALKARAVLKAPVIKFLGQMAPSSSTK
jgi:hypothetical protein